MLGLHVGFLACIMVRIVDPISCFLHDLMRAP